MFIFKEFAEKKPAPNYQGPGVSNNLQKSAPGSVYFEMSYPFQKFPKRDPGFYPTLFRHQIAPAPGSFALKHFGARCLRYSEIGYITYIKSGIIILKKLRKKFLKYSKISKIFPNVWYKFWKIFTKLASGSGFGPSLTQKLKITKSKPHLRPTVTGITSTTSLFMILAEELASLR